MRISYQWLKEYLDTNVSVEEMEQRLTLLGLEVEEVEHLGSSLAGVVVGEVIERKQHPNADRLSVCQVNLGHSVVQIVCGAPNVAAGQKVPVATVGTTLPLTLPDGKPLVIAKSKIRGEVSEGMICAEDELGLGDNHDGIMVLDATLQPGTPFSQVWPMYSDAVFVVGLTPNRPDAACHVGVARDVSAYYDLPLNKPVTSIPSQKSASVAGISVHIEAPEKCHRYVGRVIKGVTVSESPTWLKQRLLAIGLRPINNVVDATNYVLHELGQPLHAFDLNLITSGTIKVKTFSQSMPFITLDDQEREVPAGSLFICDGDTPIALAGVMGGKNSEISASTTDVFLESAYFEPSGIRKTSRALAIHTDSSFRFERGIDPNITLEAANRCAALIVELAGGTLLDVFVDEHPIVTKPIQVNLRLSRMKDILGVEIPVERTLQILHRLGFAPVKENDGITCTVPTHRPDVSREIDLIEEVARVFDYNNIPSPTTTHFHTPAPYNAEELVYQRLRVLCRSLGLNEIYTNSLLPEKLFEDVPHAVRTLNPISRDQAILRDSLLHGFLRSAAYNLNRSVPGVRFFEVGQVFKTDERGTYHKGVSEETQFFIGLAGEKSREHWTGKQTFYSFADIQALVMALLQALNIHQAIRIIKEEQHFSLLLKNKTIGKIQEIATQTKSSYGIETPVFVAELNLSELIPSIHQAMEQTMRPIPRFPAFEYDAAFVVDKQVDAGAMMEVIRKTAGKLLIHLDVFDVFEGKSLGESNKSIAFRMNFRDDEKTLTINEVQPVVDKVVQQLGRQFNAQLRS